MFVAEIKSKGKNGKIYRSVVLRENYRDGKKVKSRTLSVLTRMPPHVIESVRKAVREQSSSLSCLAQNPTGDFVLRAGESFGAVWVLFEIAKQLGITAALGVTFQAQLALWQVLARVLSPGSSLLAMVRLASNSAAPAILKFNRPFDEDSLYANGEWLSGRQDIIETRLWKARKPELPSDVFLYDVSSSYFERSCNAFAEYGYNRDKKQGKKQIVFGLLTDSYGEPCAIRAFPGNTNDLKTITAPLQVIKQHFGCSSVTMVGDRGMIRNPQISELHEAGFHYITALTKPQMETLLNEGTIQLGIFDETITEVFGPNGQRYILRRNPIRQQEIADSRKSKEESIEKLIKKLNVHLTEHPKAKVATQTKTAAAKIKKLKAKWLSVQEQGRSIKLVCNQDIKDEISELDGCYILKTDLEKDKISSELVHQRYKDLAQVERDFRNMKTGCLECRPWFVTKKENTEAHVFTCMLALKIPRFLEKAWKPLNLTVLEGIELLKQIIVTDLVHRQSNEVVASFIPQPSEKQQQLLDALGLVMPQQTTKAVVNVGTRKNLCYERKI